MSGESEFSFLPAREEDAAELVRVYNSAFYADYCRFGYCPGYGRSASEMAQSIRETPKYAIRSHGRIVGVVSARDMGGGEWHIGCLCVIPGYQGHGIGTRALEFLKETRAWTRLTLVTPTDKRENVEFYTRRGFRIVSEELEGSVRLYRFSCENGGSAQVLSAFAGRE